MECTQLHRSSNVDALTCPVCRADPPAGCTVPVSRAKTRVSVRMVWYGMVEVCEGAPVAVSGWVLTDRHDVRPCAASSLHRGTVSVSNIMGGRNPI